MKIECMREQLCEVYPYPKWRQKVTRMHESQVVAIWKNLMKRNELYEHKQKEETSHQISIWEWIRENERNGSDQKCQTIF